MILGTVARRHAPWQDKPIILSHSLSSDFRGINAAKVFLEFVRGHPTDTRMGTDGIVICFDVGENIRLCLCAGLVMLVVNKLVFEAAEEILGDGIVIRIAFA